MTEVSVNLWRIMQFLDRHCREGRAFTPSFISVALNLPLPELERAGDEGMQQGFINWQMLLGGELEVYPTPSGSHLWRMGEIGLRGEGIKQLAPPIFNAPRYVMDDWTKGHLEQWLKNQAPIDYELWEAHHAEMIEWMESQPKDEMNEAMNHSWARVFDLWTSR